jgi:hypothetical protein
MKKSFEMPPELLAITNNRQREFCRLVALEGLPAYEAYIRAGYASKCARANATKLKANESIQSAINALQQQSFSESVMSRAEALALQSKMARGNMGDFVDDQGNVDIKKLKKGAVITKLKIRRRLDEDGATIEDIDMTMADPQKAAKDLAQMEAWNKQPEPPKDDPKQGANLILEAMREINATTNGIDPESGKDLRIDSVSGSES